MRKSSEGIPCKGFAVALLTAILLWVSAQAALAQSNVPESAKETPVALKPVQVAKVEAAEAVAVHTRYTFTGEGSWFTASNWENERMPPASLKPGEQVIINGSGPCLYGQAKPFTIGMGSSVEVKAGKTLYLSIGNSFVLQGGTLTNNGDLTVVSGTLTTRGGTAGGKIVNTGKVNSTKLSTIDGDIEQPPAATRAIPHSKATPKQ